MKYLCVMIFCGLAAATAAAQQVQPKLDTALANKPADRALLVDRIVAVVNDEVITQRELNDRIAFIARQLEKQGTPLPARDILSRQVLDRMISELSLAQVAKENGIKVDDTQLERAIAGIARDNKLDLAGMRAALEKDGINYNKFRDDIRAEMVQSRLREREVESTINVAESEVDNVLVAEKSRATSGQEYQLQHVLITVPDKADAAQIAARKKRAEDAAAQIARGDDFSKVAASFSDAPDGLQGGNLGWRPPERLPALFNDAIAPLQPGQTTGILRSPNGFHIIKLVDRRGTNQQQTVAQTKVRHILLVPGQSGSDADIQKRMLTLKERIEKGEDFGALAKANSVDGSAQAGGELGWVSPGDLVAEFEKAMNALKPNEVSAPVQSQFGWHLIQVLERRSETLTDEKKRAQIRLALRGRKSEEAYQDWVRQVRDRAYVDNRLEER
ncbi:MAG: peptidylprolyl isomerase [Burkholderiales bacterium]